MSKISYRPTRSTFKKSMDEIKDFDTVKELYLYLVKDHSVAFGIDDLSISYYGFDRRCNKETYCILTRRYNLVNYIELYGHPQILGYVYFNESEYNNE